MRCLGYRQEMISNHPLWVGAVLTGKPIQFQLLKWAYVPHGDDE